MGKILHFIAKETQGECFTSFKYCYDNVATPIEYDNEDAEETCIRYGLGSLSYLEQEKKWDRKRTGRHSQGKCLSCQKFPRLNNPDSRMTILCMK